jgi:hypothetical protein
MATGYLCGSPAQKDQIFCYHHRRDRQRKANLRAGLAAKFRAGEEDLNAEIVASLDLPAPDDPEAAVICLSNTFLALAAGAIPEKRAALMIYNLQTVNSAMYNLLKHREQLAKQQNGVAVERAVTDPEPIASFLLSHRQADYDFSAQQYAQRLETEKQNPTQRHGDTEGLDENQPQHQKQNLPQRRGGAEDSCSADVSSAVSQASRLREDADSQPAAGCRRDSRQAAGATLEAAFNADAARMQALEHGDLARPAEAPHSPQEVEAAVGAMSADDWEKYVQHLWLCGFVNDAQRDKLHAKVFHADRNVRAAARFLALKYAPEKVREVLGSQSQVASGQSGSEERIA